MKKEITELRRCMHEEGVDVYVVPASDPHGSEYVNDHYKASEFLSGLLAENETLVVTADGAWIWTDSRFFLQADRELAGSGIELMKMREEGVPEVHEFVAGLAEEFRRDHEADYVVGFDGRTMPAGFEKELEGACAGTSGVIFRGDEDLAGRVWTDRPEIKPSRIWELPMSSAGKTPAAKVAEVREAMDERGADCLVLTDLAETAWLFNLRGADIDYTPVFFSYTMITMDHVRLYIMDGALDEVPEYLSFLEIRNYDDIYSDLHELPVDWDIWMDLSSANAELYFMLPDRDNVIDEPTPVRLAKTVKNEVEIASTINAHIKDGVAVTKFIKWIKDEMAKRSEASADAAPLTEIRAADHLEGLRREQDGCFDLSFQTISGYGPNGAIVHYAPSPETDLEIRPEGFLLVDSGGQYVDGTTDITRTIAVGPLTQDMIDNYTLVLKGHIALSRYRVTSETTHKELDDCTRIALREKGLEFGHGVSHGVGHVLTVHEGPAGISKKDEPCGLRAGMIVSNEPGVYIAGEYGIRIENEILFSDAGDGALTSEPITMVPYERKAINTALMTEEEIAWVNDYHAKVRETIVPLLDDDTAAFVMQETAPLS